MCAIHTPERERDTHTDTEISDARRTELYLYVYIFGARIQQKLANTHRRHDDVTDQNE